MECRSRLPRALEDAYAFIQRHADRGMTIARPKRTDTVSLPLRATRELLVDAVVHADYAQHGAPIRVSLFDDRIEIENPGILSMGLTIDDIRHGVSRLRNRVIGRIFKELGKIEQRGSAIERTETECATAGLPPPEFEGRGFRFRVTLRLAKQRTPSSDAVTDRINELLTAKTAAQGLFTQQIARAVKLTPRAVRTRLAKLIDRGQIAVVGKNERDPQQKYFWRN